MTSPDVLHLTLQQLEAFLARSRGRLSSLDYEIAEALVNVLHTVHLTLTDRHATIAKLRKILLEADPQMAGGADNVRPGPGESSESDPPSPSDLASTCPSPGATEGDSGGANRGEEDDEVRRTGHGRNGADAYRGVAATTVEHPSLSLGAVCPECQKGKLCAGRTRRIIRIVGQPSLTAHQWITRDLRCSSCGSAFPVPLPAEARGPKYGDSAAAMIALMKYGGGFPFYRLQRHQADLGIPLPASVAWEVVRDAAAHLAPVFDEFLRQSARATVVYHDDTSMRILAQMDGSKGQPWEKNGKIRTGLFTSAIVAETASWKIALFFTGRFHAGENLAELLIRRPATEEPVIQMCDAASRNSLNDADTILANCNAHARQKFVEIAPSFPAESRRVIEDLRKVYRIDARAKREKLTPYQRLNLHRGASGPIMKQLHAWLKAQIRDKKVEPNSAAGESIAYLLNHWQELTVFLRIADAPLDNNICERALKIAILHRKNALFYKTARGAVVGDLFMSLIHTCRLNGVRPFDYLTALLKHRESVRRAPGIWLPWNYEKVLAELNSG
jgi:transposase